MMSGKSWHINDDNEVNACHAENSCRFGGDSGSQDHFTDYQSALHRAEERNTEDHGPVFPSKASQRERTAYHAGYPPHETKSAPENSGDSAGQSDAQRAAYHAGYPPHETKAAPDNR